MASKPFVIALTGGPCAGKTTLLDRLRKADTLAGRKLLFVPEAATILVGRGYVIGEDVPAFQTEVLRLQLELEGEARAQAATLEAPCVIVCDRGTLDGAGYCSPEVFSGIIATFDQTRESLAQRYDLVVHLVSAAVEAPEAYTTGNNAARIETLAEAIAQEHRTRDAWAGHPRRVIVESPGTFEEKIGAAIEAMERALR